MDKEEVLKSIRRRSEMINDIRKGKDVICPKCKKGHMKNIGNLYFHCDNEECDAYIMVEPIRDDIVDQI